MDCPRVSVLMCTYNGLPHIESAIQSILSQTYTDFELIVVDDGSTDKTMQLVESTRDPRIRLIAHETNCGYAGAMNTALRAARGRYIMPMDHDDIAMPERIERAVAFLEARPDIDGCGFGHIVLGPRWLAPIKMLRYKLRAAYRPPAEVAAATLFSGLFFTPTTCVRAELLQRLPSWHNTNLLTGSDDDFYERLIAAGARLAIAQGVAIQYRRHPGNLSRKHPEVADFVRTCTARQAVLRLVPHATPEELALHDRIVLRDKHLCPDDLAAVRAWFETILAAPLTNHAYDADTLRYTLARQWQRVCALVACHDLNAGIQAYRDFTGLTPYNRSLWPLLYQYQRRWLPQRFSLHTAWHKATRRHQRATPAQ